MKLYTYKTAAELLKCSESKVQKMVLAGEIPFIKIGSRTRILDEDLHAWLRRQRQSNCSEDIGPQAHTATEAVFVRSK